MPPLLAPLAELLPISGDVSIVQSKESPFGSSIVTLRDDVLIATPVAPLLGSTPEKIGGLFVVVDPGGGT